MSILEDIYNNNYNVEATKPGLPQKMREESAAFWDKVTEVLGRKLVEEQIYRLYVEETEDNIHSFREGFRLGALLMLELK